MDSNFICTAMNLKKLAMWLEKEPEMANFKRSLSLYLVEITNSNKKQTELIQLSSVCS